MDKDSLFFLQVSRDGYGKNHNKWGGLKLGPCSSGMDGMGPTGIYGLSINVR